MDLVTPTRLQEIPLFSTVPLDILHRLSRDLHPTRYRSGETVFSEDQRCRHLHIVLSGAVKIFKVSEDGREQIIHVMRPGSFFGEDICFAGDRYEAHAQALADTLLLNIERDTLETLVRECPAFALALLANFGHRLKRLMMLIGEISLQSVRQRLCRALLELADETGGPCVRGRLGDLAARVGAARETVCRALSRLEAEGLLRKEPGGLRLDLLRLAQEVPHWREDVQLFPLDPARFQHR